MNFWNIIKKHKVAIVLAVLVGIVMAFPHFYFGHKNVDVYRGIMMGGLDEGPYLSRIQEVRDGYYWMANPFWAEGKSLPHLWPPLSENVASIVGSIFGLNVVNTVLLGNFVFPFFIFMFIYFLCFGLTQRKKISLLAGLIIMLAPNLTNHIDLWRLISFRQATNTFLAYSRLISPQIHSFFFFLFFLLFWLFWEKRKWHYGVLSGVVMGLTFYVYPFSWMFIGSTLFFLMIISLIRRKWVDIKNIISVGVVALFVAIPFVYNLWQAMHYTAYSDVSLRYGWVLSRIPQVGATMLILLGFFILFFPRWWQLRYDFCLAIVLAPFLINNQQMITGYFLGPARYHHYYYKPFAIIFLLIICVELVNKMIENIKLRKIILVSCVGLILSLVVFNAGVVQVNSYKTYEPMAIENQKYMYIFEWFNSNADKDDIILANTFISDLIPTYTSLNVILNLDAHYSLVSEHQLLERMFLQYYIDGLNPQNALEVFFRDREDISKKIYAQRYQKQFGTYDKIPDEKLYDFESQYQDFVKDNSVEDYLQYYHIDYLIWDSITDLHWAIDKYSSLNYVYGTDSGLKIYEFYK